MDIKLNEGKLEYLFVQLSEAFKCKYEVAQTEYYLHIPSEFGSGTISAVNYPNGVGFVCINATFKDNLNLIYGENQHHPLRFVYCLKNILLHRFDNEDIIHEIDEFDSAIIANKYPYGDIYSIGKDKFTSITFLEIDRKLFTSQLPKETHEMKPIFYEIFFDVFATRILYHKSHFSLRLALILKQIDEFDHGDFVRINFIGAKALEMLSFMLLQYEDDLRDEGSGRILRKSEITAIHNVANLINEDLMNLSSVDDLAKEAGLTPAKLQEGFKLLYGNTVNQYIVDRRLEKAFWLLSQTDSQISDVVLEIGFSSRSHFSKIFKEKYDISPIDVKLQRRSK
ncbi:helix-turn-helix domain-containing protein [Flavimarina sp. Hel_I_48]|uniref:helix-turn-helix domain-containing protein n=1 Tax=Flavimarina sp. Hel_I_48 TaxID=1392488 RepID=UPI0004DFA21F|nr:response regulator transcription factor [Flavimarina sp. Hel_I_48]